MSKSMSRRVLYDLVWAQPMRTIAKQFEVSDVALGKACRAANIPTPGLGYWAKKEAGKRVDQAKLERERIERLLSDARCLREAEEIRAYVAFAKAFEGRKALRTEGLDEWTSWALAQADQHDPLTSGRFARSIVDQHIEPPT